MLLHLLFFFTTLLPGQTRELARRASADGGPVLTLSMSNTHPMLRLEIRNSSRTHSIELDRAAAEDLRRMAAKLQSDVETIHRRGFDGIAGLCEYRDNPGKYPVQIDYCMSGACAQSLRVSGPGHSYQTFRGRTPGDLAEQLAIALREMEAAANR